jgi:hypothetical protein
VALVDRENASHRQRVSEIFRHCGSVFKTTVVYQICDFFECPRLTTLVNITNASEPVYLALNNYKGNIAEIMYREKKKSPTAMRVWLRAQMNGQKELEKIIRKWDIPVLPAMEFLNVTGNRSWISVVLIGSPRPDYEDVLKKLCEIRSWGDLNQYGQVRFFRFDPVLQPIGGIQMNYDGELKLVMYVDGMECQKPVNLTGSNMLKDLKSCIKGGSRS